MSPLFTKTHSLSTQGLVKILIDWFIHSLIHIWWPRQNVSQNEKCTNKETDGLISWGLLHLSTNGFYHWKSLIYAFPMMLRSSKLTQNWLSYHASFLWDHFASFSQTAGPILLGFRIWNLLVNTFPWICGTPYHDHSFLCWTLPFPHPPSETISLRSCQPMALAFRYFRFGISLSIPSCGCVAHSATITRSWARAYPLLLPLPILILYSIGTTRAMA